MLQKKKIIYNFPGTLFIFIYFSNSNNNKYHLKPSLILNKETQFQMICTLLNYINI